MSYDNTNTGAMFKNDKQGNEKRPDYTGKINVEGKDYFLSSWIKESKDGNKFLSLSVKSTDQKKQEKESSDMPF